MRLPLRKIKVFSKEWFRFWQPLLLLAINFPVKGIREEVRHRLRIDQDNLPLDVPIVELMPHAYTVMTGWNKYQTTFRTHDKYAKRLFYEWKYIWDLVHKWDTGFANKFIPALNLGFDTLIAYPSAGVNSPVDGYVMGYDNTSYSNARNGVNLDVSVYGSYLYMSNEYTDNYYVGHGLILFNTSILTNQATIEFANIALWVISHVENNLGHNTQNIVSSNPNSESNIIDSDYFTLGSTIYASKSHNNITNSIYNTFSLDNNGIANLSLVGVSKFGIITSGDINNLTPTAENATVYYSADQTGTTQDPKLTVEYTLPVTFVPQIWLF